MLNLKGKIAVVCGCGSHGNDFGNGRAIATTLARQGAQVVGVDIDKDAGENTRDFIVKEGNFCEFYQVNMKDESQVKKLSETLELKYKSLDILVNVVGQSEPGGPAGLHRSVRGHR